MKTGQYLESMKSQAIKVIMLKKCKNDKHTRQRQSDILKIENATSIAELIKIDSTFKKSVLEAHEKEKLMVENKTIEIEELLNKSLMQVKTGTKK